jgi:predicted RNase H-like HicB family nuclease
MSYTAIITQTEDGWYVGQCEEVPEAITQAQSLEELNINLLKCIIEALDIKRTQTRQLYVGQKHFQCTLELT